MAFVSSKTPAIAAVTDIAIAATTEIAATTATKIATAIEGNCCWHNSAAGRIVVLIISLAQDKIMPNFPGKAVLLFCGQVSPFLQETP